MRVKLLDDREGPATHLDAEEALELIFEGRAILAPHQPTPPFELVEALAEKVRKHEAFGPKMNEPEMLAVISEKVFQNGVEQLVVDGLELRWFKSGLAGEKAIQTFLIEGASSQQNLLGLAQCTLTEYLHSRAVTVKIRGGVSEARATAERLLRTRQSNFLDGTSDYHELSDPWWNFWQRLEHLKAGMDLAIETGLSEGRIIVAQMGSGSSRLVHPNQTNLKMIKTTKADCSFCLSSSFPKTWFGKDEPLHKKKKQATEWMVRAFRHFEAQGRRATMKDLKQIACEKFNLSENAAKVACAEAGMKIGKRFRNVKYDLKVSINEIREIE